MFKDRKKTQKRDIGGSDSTYMYCGSPKGGLPYITDGDARRNFQKQSQKVMILGVAPANFIP